MSRKLVPKLRFPEFRDAGEWDRKRLGEISQIVRGGSPRPIDSYLTTDSNGLNWLKIGDISPEAKYVIYTKERVRVDALKKTREVYPNDLILSNSMSFGRPYILKIKTCIHDGWIAISKIDKSINTDYLYYCILSPFSQLYFSNNAAGSGVQNLNADIIKLLPSPIPPLPEQQRIADCLTSLDDRITLETQKLDALRAHKKGLMQQLFPAEGQTLPQLRFPKFRDAGEWELTALGKVSTITSGGTPNRSNKDFWNGAIPWVTTSLIDFNTIYKTDEFISESGLKGSSAKLFPKNTILMAMYGQGKTRGKVAILGIEATTNQACAAILLNKGLHIDFLFQNLVGRYDEIRELSNRGGQENLSAGLIEQIPISYPPDKNEQQRIADCLTSLDDRITLQAQKIELLKHHKKGLMQQLFPAVDEVSR